MAPFLLYCLLMVAEILLVAAVLFLPILAVWFLMLFCFGSEDSCFSPLFAHVKATISSLRQRYDAPRYDEDEFQKRALSLANDLQSSAHKKDLTRVFAVTSVCLLEFWRQSWLAGQAYRKLWPTGTSTLLGRVRGFLRALVLEMPGGRVSDYKQDMFDFTVGYGLLQGKTFATERPLVDLTPRTLSEERGIEDSFLGLQRQLSEPHIQGEAAHREILAEFVRINEAQTFLYSDAPRHLFAVSATDDEPSLADSLKNVFDPRTSAEKEFHTWFRGACAAFECKTHLYRRGGKVGRRVALAFLTLRGFEEQLERMPVYQRHAEYKRQEEILTRSFSVFYMALCRYLLDNSSAAKATFLEAIGVIQADIYRVCGNYRKMSPIVKWQRQLDLFRGRSKGAFAESRFWFDLCASEKVLTQQECTSGAGPVFDACVADTRAMADPERQVWNLMALLNCPVKSLSAFLVAASAAHSPADYDRVVSVGTSGIVPGSLLAAAFRKRQSICFLHPSCDLFPLSPHLEKIAVVDDSSQTGFTLNVILGWLRRLGYVVDETDIMVVLKLVEADRQSAQACGTTELPLGHCRSELIHSVVEYMYSDAPGVGIPSAIRDGSRVVRPETVAAVISHLAERIARVRSTSHISFDTILNRYKIGKFFKPWLLMNYPDELLWLAEYCESDVSRSGYKAVIASSPLDLPLLSAMSLIHRISPAVPTEMLFLFYDRERDRLNGLGVNQGMEGWDCAILDCTVKSGRMLDSISKIVAKRGGRLSAIAAGVSLLRSTQVHSLAGREIIPIHYVSQSAVT